MTTYAAVMSSNPAAGSDRPMRRTILDVTAQLTVQEGWANLTMGRIAQEVGVSRQTVYNEFGSKTTLAEELVMRELARFLQVVQQAFEDHPDDFIDAVRAAVRGVLEFAAGNALLHTALNRPERTDSDLLALITSDSAPLLDSAKAVVTAAVENARVEVSPTYLPTVVDLVVRTILSHVVTPSGTPQETADGIAWATSRLIGPGARH